MLRATFPSISVLMPTYEQSRFIRRALDSLLAQTLTDWEAIIVDDGSQDATAQAVSPYLHDDRICYHKFSENKGLGKALNEGLANAKAPLVAYLPSDDVYYRDHLHSLKTCLERQRNPCWPMPACATITTGTLPGRFPDRCSSCNACIERLRCAGPSARKWNRMTSSNCIGRGCASRLFYRSSPHSHASG